MSKPCLILPILPILLLISLLKAQPSSFSAPSFLQDTCISGHNILPEKSFFIGKYQIGDSVYSKDQVFNLLSKNPSTQGIMTSSKVFFIIGGILACTGIVGGNIGLKDNNPVLAFTSVGISFSGIGLIFSSFGLSKKAIKTYNRSLCNKE